MMWSAAWTCGTSPGDNGLEAQMLGFIQPGSSNPPVCGDLSAGNFILDVTDPAARAWFRDKLAAFIAANDIDGIKLDRGEEHLASESTHVWANGQTGREVRNAYPTLQAQMHHEALAAAHPDGDFVLFSRPGYTGTQPWADLLGWRHLGQRGLRRRQGHRPRPAERHHQPAACRLHGLSHLGLGHRRLLRVQGP